MKPAIRSHDGPLPRLNAPTPRPQASSGPRHGPPRSEGVLAVRERILAGGSAEARQIELRSGRRVHVIEAGEGAPVLFLHGSGTSSLSLLPVLERLEGVWAIAVDRPGFGMSDPVQVPRERFRDAAIEFVDEVLDGLKLETCTLAGQSMGGTWGIWYALAQPDRVRRLALLGSAPLLPGTRPPAALRMMVMPVIGDLLAHAKPNAKMVVRLMSSFGEAETIVRHPDLIEGLVAAGQDPIASAANLAELRAIISPLGFRRSVRIDTDELCRLTVPTLLIWGDHDPVGAVEAAQASAAAIPDAQLEVLPGGHVPYLRSPERASENVSEFVRAGSNG
jgi:pimeloyl-ACP methyl ester carboxylesterase